MLSFTESGHEPDKIALLFAILNDGYHPNRRIQLAPRACF